MASLVDFLKLFCLANLKSTFPNLYVIIKICVTLPVSSCSAERTFSKLKLIKTRLRTTMSEDRLGNLMKISCEQDLCLDKENVIQILASKSPYLTKELIF